MKNKTKWEDIGFVASSEYRKKILKILEEMKMPSSLSKKLNINKAHVSRALRELLEKKMIECKNPDTRKGKIYIRTNYGNEILNAIKDL